MFQTRTDLAKYLTAHDKIAFNVRNNYIVCKSDITTSMCPIIPAKSQNRMTVWRRGHLTGLLVIPALVRLLS
jgi:hypothetical protein